MLCVAIEAKLQNLSHVILLGGVFIFVLVENLYVCMCVCITLFLIVYSQMH